MDSKDILTVCVARTDDGWAVVAVLRDGSTVPHATVHPTFERAMLACIRASMLGLADFLKTP